MVSESLKDPLPSFSFYEEGEFGASKCHISTVEKLMDNFEDFQHGSHSRV